MSAIDAITKSSSGGGQATGKTGVTASGSFEQLFAISTEVPINGEAQLNAEGVGSVADLEPVDAGSREADDGLDLILGFSPVAMAEIALPPKGEALVAPGLSGEADFGMPQVPVVPIPPVALDGEVPGLPPRVAPTPGPEHAGQVPLETVIAGDPSFGAEPSPVVEAGGVTAAPPQPGGLVLGPEGRGLDPARQATLSAVQEGGRGAALPADAPAVSAASNDSVSDLIARDAEPVLARAGEHAGLAKGKKEETPAPIRSAALLGLASDAPQDLPSQEQGQIIARIRIVPAGEVSPQPLAMKPAADVTADQLSMPKADTDLDEPKSEPASAQPLAPKGQVLQPGPQASRPVAVAEPASPAPVVAVSTAPAAELLRATLDTRDAAWRERLVTQLLGDTRAGTQSMTLSLRPKSLGDIQLSVDMGGGETTVRIVAETPAAVRLIIANEDLLSNLMEQAGVRLAGLSVQHMAGPGAMSQAAGQIAAQGAGGAAAREGNGLRKDRSRSADMMRAAPETNLKLGDGSQLGINLMA